MEREQSLQQPVSLEDAALSTPAARLLETLQRARNSEAQARLNLAGELITQLRARPAEGDRESVAQLIIEKLDDEAFHDLYDADGASCRAVAVESVLALGFPWALHVWPDDLEYLRAMKPLKAGSPTLRAMALVTGVLAALFALAFFIHL